MLVFTSSKYAESLIFIASEKERKKERERKFGGGRRGIMREYDLDSIKTQCQQNSQVVVADWKVICLNFLYSYYKL